jgi:Ulp1 family protease
MGLCRLACFCRCLPQVVNVYMKLLQQRDSRLRALSATLRRQKSTFPSFPTCHFFPTFFYNKLYQDKNVYDYSVRVLLRICFATW